MAISIQVERFSDVIEEAEPLLEKHWEEIALNRDHVPLSPDYSQYAADEASGTVLVITARDDGVLVGYACFLIVRSRHYSTTLWAINDVIWLAPEHRRAGTGNDLLDLAEKRLKGLGIVILHFSAKVDHPALGKLLEARGYRMVETVYALTLNRAE